MVTIESAARDGRRQAAAAAGGLRAALVCLLVAAGQRHGAAAAPPASRVNPPQQRTSSLRNFKVECPVLLQPGPRSGGGQHVNVSAPAHCRCDHLELSVLQRRGIPCQPGTPRTPGYRCAWMTAHAAATNTSSASFLVSVGGQFRPVARCQPQWPAKEGARRRRRVRLYAGKPVTLPGIDLPSWNVSVAASDDGYNLEVRVKRQMNANDTDAYFPELYVTLYRPPRDDEYGPRRVAYRRVAFSPAEQGAKVDFSGEAPVDLYGYQVDVRPAGSWVCQGANDGCQKRYAMVQELLKLSAEAKANRGIEA